MSTKLSKSSLEGEITNLEGARWHGAKIDNMVNETGTRLPSKKELKVPEEGSSGLFGFLSSKKEPESKIAPTIVEKENKESLFTDRIKENSDKELLKK